MIMCMCDLLVIVNMTMLTMHTNHMNKEKKIYTMMTKQCGVIRMTRGLVIYAMIMS